MAGENVEPSLLEDVSTLGHAPRVIGVFRRDMVIGLGGYHDDTFAEDVKEIGQIESQPLLDGRNMVMVLGPTKNAGIKRDAEDQNIEQRQEAV